MTQHISQEVYLAEKIQALETVETLAQQLGAAEGVLERGYAQFAEALLRVQEGRYWEGDYESWGAYIRFITDKFKMGKAQLYHKVAVVRELRGIVSADDLTDMGISKASVLAESHRLTGTLENGIIECAKLPQTTAKDIRKALALAAKLPEDEGKEWLDMGFSFMVTPEQKATLLDAEKAARFADPVTDNSAKEATQKLDVAMKLSQEFLGAYRLPTENESI